MTRSYVWHTDSNHLNESYCSSCKAWKPKSEFHVHSSQTNELQQICKDCNREARGETYAKDPERAKAINRVSMQNVKEKSREYVFQYLSEHPCVDCGQTDSLVLTFDHVRGKKKENISNMIGRGWAIETIQGEIAKCDVVCFNCHMRREEKRRR
jgi:hypothetical protein